MNSQSGNDIPLKPVGVNRQDSGVVGVSTGIRNADNEGTLETTFLHTEPIESQKPSEEPTNGLKAYSVVIGSFLGLIANFGVLNSIGAIQSYVSLHQLKDIETSSISWIFSIYMYLSFAIGIIVGPIFVMKGSFAPLLYGTVLIVGGFMATANCTKVWQFILSFICVGTGHGLCITPLVGVVSQHWTANAIGRATGFATIGGSIGGVILPLMLRSLFPKVGFAWSIRILGFFCLACMICAMLLAREKYCTDLIPMDSASTDYEEMNKRKKFKAASKNILSFNALRDIKYSFLIIGVFFGELALMLIVTYYASYAIAQGMSESAAYILLTIFNACGVLGRWIPGHMADIWGPYNVMILMLICLDISIMVVWLPFGSNVGVLYAFAALSGAFSASILSLLPVLLSSVTVYSIKKVKVSKQQNPFAEDEVESTEVRYPLEFGQKYGLLYFFVSLGNLFGIPIASAVIGDKSKHNYDMFVLLSGIFAIIGTVFWIISRYCIVGFKLNVKI